MSKGLKPSSQDLLLIGDTQDVYDLCVSDITIIRNPSLT